MCHKLWAFSSLKFLKKNPLAPKKWSQMRFLALNRRWCTLLLHKEKRVFKHTVKYGKMRQIYGIFGPKQLAPPFCWTKFPKKVAKFETKFPKFSPKFAPKFAPKFSPKFLVLSWQVEKSSPKISPDLSHRRFQISNRIRSRIHRKFHKHTSAGLAARPKRLKNAQGLWHLINYISVALRQRTSSQQHGQRHFALRSQITWPTLF